MSRHTPPQLFLSFFRWYCHPDFAEDIEGDLIERFERRVDEKGIRLAQWRFTKDVIMLFRPGIIKKFNGGYKLSNYDMFRNNFKIMLRNLIKRKSYAIINILGLTLGITFAVSIGVFIWGELQVNADLKDVDRLYLLESEYKTTKGNLPFFTPIPLAQQAVEQYPTMIEAYYQFRDRQITLSKENINSRVQSMIGTSTFLDIFGFPVLYGNIKSAFLHPNSIVITEQIARQYFNKSDVLGESLTISTEVNGLKEFIITAVIADLQKKNTVSDFMNMDAQVFLSLEHNDSNFVMNYTNDWSTDIISYVKLSPDTKSSEAKSVLNQLLAEHTHKEDRKDRVIDLKPLQDYYLITNHGSVQKLIISLTIIVIFILLLAIANFINLTISISLTRLKEVGLRKSIGGVRRQILFQFLLESIFLAVFSTILSLFLYELLRSYFGEALNTVLPSITQFSFSFWLWIAAATVLIGLLSGCYPAIYLSTASTIESLKGKFKSVKGTIQFSKGLITLQFLIAIFVLVTGIIMSEQISYFFRKDMGYDKSFVLTVSSVPRLWTEEGFSKMDIAKQKFLASSKVKSVSLSWGSPNLNFSPISAKINVVGKLAEDGIQASISSVDEDYAKVYQLELSEGKFFSEEGEIRALKSVVINESAEKLLGTDLGEQINLFDDQFTVVGVMKDFNFESLHQTVKPVVLMHNKDFMSFRHFSFKLQSSNMAESISDLEQIWKNVFPNDPFIYSFPEERLQIMYKTELQLKKAASIAMPLILVIVFIGVLGLVSLSVSKKTKEIGIRKVLGASTINILRLISREYIVLMVLALIISSPMTFLFITKWLDGFAYRIDLKWWMFIIPTSLLFLITLTIIIVQSLKTAQSNPVDSLRNE